MLLYPEVNELRKKADSRYTLVVLTAKRARDIISGKPVLTEVKADRPVSLAANEIAEDIITYSRATEAVHSEDVQDELFAAAEASADAELSEEE